MAPLRTRWTWLLGGAAVLLAAGATLALTLWLMGKPRVEPFYGVHQSGITTGPQKFAFVAAFDLTVTSADGVRDLLKAWSRASEAMARGATLGPDVSEAAPPADTGETMGYRAAGLTVTFGVGPSVFDGRFGLADRKPAALQPLPAFKGDNLNPAWSDGDLVIQAAADDLQTAYHALHVLTRLAKGSAVLKWVQQGFQPGQEVTPGPGRNLEGFIDGTVNPNTKKAEDMSQVVWAQTPDWMKNGSYLVVRRIRMFAETWDRSSLGDQEKTIGRVKSTGTETAARDPSSHVALARGAGVEKILRRPFHYVNGLDPRTGQWDIGLLFLAWMKDPGRQFVPMQTRISNYDLLNEYIQPMGSAVFAVFPGAQPGSYVGAGLFPDEPLTKRIEALEAQVGALYPALGRQDWAAVRQGLAEWTANWDKLRPEAGSHTKALQALRDAWAESLAPAQPANVDVRARQVALVKGLGAWQESLAAQAPSATDLGALKADLAAVAQALKAGNVEAARTGLAAFQKDWISKESLVRSLDAEAYGVLELGAGDVRRGLQGPTPSPTVAATVEAMAQRLGTLESPKAFGAWDAGFLLFREGLEALLVLAALLAFLGRTDQKKLTPWVWSGAGVGLAASIGVAVLISVAMSGWMAATASTVVEAVTGLAAVILMLTVGIWLHGKAAIRDWNRWIKDRLGKAGNNPWALGSLALLAVLREGAETVVFFWGLAGSLSLTDLFLGVAGAGGVLAVLGVVLIRFSKRLPLQWFFPLATALIYFLAVKILGQSLGSFQASGWLPSTPLGFGAPLEAVGFSPTWETAGPQVVLAIVLVTALVVPLVRKKKAP